MGLKDWKIVHRVPANWNADTTSCHVGVFGKDDYLFWLEGGDNHEIHLVKYRFPDIFEANWILYRDENKDKPAPVGAGVVIKGRLYFYNHYTKCVEWIEYKDDIGNYPERHPILSTGLAESQLQFEYTDFKGWTATPYKNAYLFHCDIGTHRILVTDLDGNFKGVFGEYGSLHGQFKYPCHCVVYHHPEYGDVLFVADRENGRITVWQIVSIEPEFEVIPLVNCGITGLTGDDRPQGVGIWRNQLYAHCYDHEIKEFKINDDLTLEDTGVKGFFGRYSDEHEGIGLYMNGNHLSAFTHECKPPTWAKYADLGSYVVSAIENTMEASCSFSCFSVVEGIWHDIPFSLRAGQQGVCRPVAFDLSAEGYQQINNMTSGFKFAGYAKHDVCAVIQSIPFSVKVRQRQIKEILPFSFLGHCNYMLGSAQLSLAMEMISNIFLAGENVFTFEMIANSPLTFKTELTFEVPEAEGTLVNDTIATLDLALAELVLLMLEAPKVEIDLPSLQTSGTLASPTFLSGDISVFALQLQSLIESPFSFDGRVVLNMLSISALTHQPDLLKGNLVFSSVKTNGIAYQGFDYAEMELVIEPLSVSSQMATIPLLHALISLPALEIDAHEGGQIASIEEIYQNSSLTLTSGEYPQVDGVELLGVAINLLNKSISRIANTDYMIIDLGYLDLHRDVVNQYLEIFISGYTPNQNQPIGELQIGNYSYLIEEWITENEWRVLVGKGLTRRTVQNADKRFIPIKLKLKPDFELRSIVIRATPVARRGR